jgi:hypothetical protein
METATHCSIFNGSPAVRYEDPHPTRQKNLATIAMQLFSTTRPNRGRRIFFYANMRVSLRHPF